MFCFILFFYLLSSSLFLFLLSVLHLHLNATFSTRILSRTHTLCNQQMLLLDSHECTNCADARLAVSSNLALPTQTHGALQLGSQLELPPPPRCVDRDRCSTDLSRMLVFLKATALSAHSTGPNASSTPSIKRVVTNKAVVS